VQEIRQELGDFDFNVQAPTQGDHRLEFLQMKEQANHARYEGEW
jgi:hypothetical protein